MKESKYKILWDHGSENMVFADEEFNTIDKAVRFATSMSYSAKWLIVHIVEWEAKEK